MSHLTELYISLQPIGRISKGDYLKFNKLHNLQKLFISGCSLRDAEIHESIGQLTKLTELDISSNTISDGTFIGNLTNLTTLDVNSCRMCFGNDGSLSYFSKLTNLTHLDCTYNGIKSIEPFSMLENLTFLGASNNIIHSISSIVKLKKLTFLDIGHNCIDDNSAAEVFRSMKH